MLPISQTASEEWERLMREAAGLIAHAYDIITSQAERVYQTNKVYAIIDATKPGKYVGYTGLTKEAALAAREFAEWFVKTMQDDQIFVGSPLTPTPAGEAPPPPVPGEGEVEYTPLQIVSSRPTAPYVGHTTADVAPDTPPAEAPATDGGIT